MVRQQNTSVNTALQSLSLVIACMGDAAGVALARALQVNKTLQSFALSIEQDPEVPAAVMGDGTGIALAEALRMNIALHSFFLSISDCSDPEEDHSEVPVSMGDATGTAPPDRPAATGRKNADVHWNCGLRPCYCSFFGHRPGEVFTLSTGGHH